jgi:hypothetical protein
MRGAYGLGFPEDSDYMHCVLAVLVCSQTTVKAVTKALYIIGGPVSGCLLHVGI